MKEKRILTLQDYSAMGRCSLTVALPIISACGIEAVGLPTAILSNHTQFKSWTYVDLTQEILPTIDKWADYNHHFDAIYTGYLGDSQIEPVIEVFKRLKEENTFVLVDPAFAAYGKMYPGFGYQHVELMRKLIAHADIVRPNITEACFLTGRRFVSNEADEEEIRSLIADLKKLGPSKVVLSGIHFPSNSIGCAFTNEDGSISTYSTECLPYTCHGTGDVFASVLTSKLVLGYQMKDAVKAAHDFVHAAMIQTEKDGQKDMLTYGVDFEPCLGLLTK